MRITLWDEPSRRNDLRPGERAPAPAHDLLWNLSEREGSRASFSSLSLMRLIQKHRCDCKMRSFVSVSQSLTSAAPSHNYGGVWHYSRSRQGDPLIYYSLSAGPAHVTCTVSCVLIKAHPIQGIWSPTSNATQPLNRFKLDHFHVEENGTGGNLLTTDFYSWQHIKASKNQSPNHHIVLKVAVEIQITALFQPPSLRESCRENAILGKTLEYIPGFRFITAVQHFNVTI